MASVQAHAKFRTCADRNGPERVGGLCGVAIGAVNCPTSFYEPAMAKGSVALTSAFPDGPDTARYLKLGAYAASSFSLPRTVMLQFLTSHARSERASRISPYTLPPPPDDPPVLEQQAEIRTTPMLLRNTIMGPLGELTVLIQTFLSGEPPDYISGAREICLRAAASEDHALVASTALSDHIRSVPVPECLRGVHLWALMLRYCPSESFVEKTSDEGFLRPIKEMCLAWNCDPRVRSRLSEVIAGATHAYPTNQRFRALWGCIKNESDPAEGIRFSNPQFFLPSTQRFWKHGPSRDAGLLDDAPLPHADVMHRLVVSCELAGKRAGRLSKLLATESAEQTLLKALGEKCIRSRSFIQSQLHWATVAAERSAGHPDDGEDEQTFEEQLLGMLLAANGELNDVIARYEARPVSHPEIRHSNGSESVRPTSVQSLPPPYAELCDPVEIGHALPPAILTYLERRGVPRNVLYDVELALEGSSTRSWLDALARIPGLTASDCKAIALLYRRSLPV